MYAINAHKYRISSLFSIHPIFKWYGQYIIAISRTITAAKKSEPFRRLFDVFFFLNGPAGKIIAISLTITARKENELFRNVDSRYFRFWYRLLSFWRIREYFKWINIRRENKFTLFWYSSIEKKYYLSIPYVKFIYLFEYFEKNELKRGDPEKYVHPC